MIDTEAKLWAKLDAATKSRGLFTRIETSTVAGVSDVEYVMEPWCGWVELKTCNHPRPGKPYSPHSEFTLSQASWLLAHHNTRFYQSSWLLMGVIGPLTWREYILLEPTQALMLLRGRKIVSGENLCRWTKGVYVCKTMDDVVDQLSNGGRT